MIRRYEEKDFTLLESWITTPELLFTFAGTDWTFPVAKAQIETYRAANPNKYQYLGCFKDGTPFGFAEIITNEKPDTTPRLGRILIGEQSARGKGLGAMFIEELLPEALTLQLSEQVYLYVFQDNEPAIRCYKKVGFTFSDEVSFPLLHNSKEFKVAKMEIRQQTLPL